MQILTIQPDNPRFEPARSIALAVALCGFLIGCGDDESPADAGTDAHVHDGGPGASGGRGGTGGRAGASADAGRGGNGGTAGSPGNEDAGADGTPVTIRFAAKLGDASLDCGQDYPEQGSTGVRARVQDFRMFVERVSLLTSDGREVPVQFEERAPFQTRDVALLDFTDRKGACLSGGGTINTTITGTVPQDEYDGVVFVNGVPESLNHENISTQPPPLQDPTIWWGWQSGYRFIVAEILSTSSSEEDAGTGEIGSATFVHIGSSGCTGNNSDGYTCSRPNRNRVELDDFDPATDTIVADFSKVFEPVDLSKAVQCHGPGPDCVAMYATFGLDFQSGNALSSQTVFRVE